MRLLCLLLLAAAPVVAAPLEAETKAPYRWRVVVSVARTRRSPRRSARSSAGS